MTSELRTPSAVRWRPLLLLFALALLVRAWQPAHLGVGHYDEGAYAISATGVATWPEGNLFPGQIKFSPPVYFGTVGVITKVLGVPSHLVGLWFNVVIGALLAVATAWVGIRWFGVAAGLAAGVLTAVDPLGLMLSRSGLTDPTFALLFVLALWATVEAMRRPGARTVLLAGIVTGLAWNTKYHGWFVLLIVAGASLLRRMRLAPSAERLTAMAAARRLGGVAAIAALVYLPWAIYMRGASGDRGLWGIVTYYASLIGAGWLDAAGRHVAMQGFLDGPVARLGVPLSLAVVLVLQCGRTAWSRLGAVAAMVLVVTLAAGGIGAVLLMAAVGVAAWWRQRFDWPEAVVLVWLGLWLVAAPFYHPYARLLLPVLVAVVLAAGHGLVAVARWMDAPPPHARAVPRHAVTALVALAVALAVVPFGHRGAANPWHDDRGTARAAATLHELVPGDAQLIVIGEPSLAHHLGLLGRDVPAMLVDVRDVDTVSTEMWLAAGVYARRAPVLRDAIAGFGARVDSLTSVPLDPGDLRLLDDFRAARARAWRQHPDAEFDVVLYRVRAGAPVVLEDAPAQP